MLEPNDRIGNEDDEGNSLMHDLGVVRYSG